MKWRTVIDYPDGWSAAVGEFEARYSEPVASPANNLDLGRKACNQDVGKVAAWCGLPRGARISAIRDDGLVGRVIVLHEDNPACDMEGAS